MTGPILELMFYSFAVGYHVALAVECARDRDRVSCLASLIAGLIWVAVIVVCAGRMPR